MRSRLRVPICTEVVDLIGAGLLAGQVADADGDFTRPVLDQARRALRGRRMVEQEQLVAHMALLLAIYADQLPVEDVTRVANTIERCVPWR